jgi:hypothetical protein
MRCRQPLPEAMRQALQRIDARLEEQESTNRVQAFEIKCVCNDQMRCSLLLMHTACATQHTVSSLAI